LVKFTIDKGSSAPITQSSLQSALASDKKQTSTIISAKSAQVSSPSATSPTVKSAPAPFAINPISGAPNILTSPNVTKPATTTPTTQTQSAAKTQSTTKSASSGVNTNTLAGIQKASGPTVSSPPPSNPPATQRPSPAATKPAPAPSPTPAPAPARSTQPSPTAGSQEYVPPPVNPTPYTADPPPPPPPPPPIKTADPDIIEFNDDEIDTALIIDLLLENIGGQELLTIARFDTVNGQDVKYQPIKNLGLIQQEYNPNTILKPQQTSENIFDNFPLRLNSKIPNVGNGPGGTNLYREQATGDIILEFVNIVNNEQIEVEIATSGIIYEVGI
jgi:hypothetical protein